MYNGLSRVYFIEAKGGIVYKGLNMCKMSEMLQSQFADKPLYCKEEHGQTSNEGLDWV